VSRRTPEQRAKDLDNALNWLRNKGKDDEKNDPTGELRKLDKLLPNKPGQSPKDRARDIEGALDWMRNNNVSPDDEDAVDKFNKIGSVPMSRRTPEQRAKDLDDALNWLRNKGLILQASSESLTPCFPRGGRSRRKIVLERSRGLLTG